MQVKFGAPTRLKKLTPSTVESVQKFSLHISAKNWNDSMGQEKLSYLEFYNCCYNYNSSAAIHVPTLILIILAIDPIGQNLQVYLSKT